MEALAIVHLVLSVLGALVSGAGYVVPCFTTMVDMELNGLGQRSSIPYSAGLINCLLWILYGFSPKGGWLIVSINILGACFMLYYLCKFLGLSEENQFNWALVLPAIGFVVTVCVTVFYSSDVNGNLLVLCWVCSLSRGSVALVPLLNLGVVHRQRNMQSMPSLHLTLISLLNAMLWGAFACTTDSGMDHFIFWPSFAGFLAGVVQVGLHITLRENSGLMEPLV